MSGRRDIDRLRGEIDDLFSELWQVPRFAATAGGSLAFLAYVWVAAVRNAGRVKRRKRARR